MTIDPDLIADLRRQLAAYKYSEFQEIPMPGRGTLHAIMTPRRWMVRYICAVYEIPTDIDNAAQLTAVFTQIRDQLSARYARLHWWKELGTYAVLLCSHEQYKQLAVHIGQLKDRSGLHDNLMLGTVLIDQEHFQSAVNVTWGFYYSYKHFAVMAQTVQEWCQTKLAEAVREDLPAQQARPIG